MVVDYITGSENEEAVEGAFVADILPEVSDHEFVSLYPADYPTRGCLLVSREGAYDTINLSLVERSSALDRLARVWHIVRTEARAVLVGEELGVNADEIDRLLQSDKLPADIDLCDAAIVRDRAIAPAGDERTDPWYGGRLLLR